MTEKLLIIGNGTASACLVEALWRIAPGRFTTTVVDAAAVPNLDRPSDVSGKADWHESMGASLIDGQNVESLCSGGKTARLADGRSVDFDICVFATGSTAERLPVPGARLPGVVGFRDAEDIAAMKEAAKAGRRIVVIGGGLPGVETACDLADLGADVTLVHVMDGLMERQLDMASAELLKLAIEQKGVKVELDRQTRAITGSRRATGVDFAGGGHLPADLIVMAVGTRPQATLAARAGIGVNHGILVDDHLATTLPDVYAIGSCAEHRGHVYGFAEPVRAQAEALARRLSGDLSQPFASMVPAATLRVPGIELFSVGDFLGAQGTQTITAENVSPVGYRKLVFAGDRLAGAILFGDTGDAPWYLGLIRSSADISAMRSDLIFGRQRVESASAAAA